MMVTKSNVHPPPQVLRKGFCIVREKLRFYFTAGPLTCHCIPQAICKMFNKLLHLLMIWSLIIFLYLACLKYYLLHKINLVNR